jgi:hypothetical protein
MKNKITICIQAQAHYGKGKCKKKCQNCKDVQVEVKRLKEIEKAMYERYAKVPSLWW